MQFATATAHCEGVTLVHCRLENDRRTPRRVRVANRLDGPVWFPRRAGHPATGWDDGGYEGVLVPGETRALGYACPAEPADPPADVAWTERAARSDEGEDAPARAATWALEDPRPPRDAVPVGAVVQVAVARSAELPACGEYPADDRGPNDAGQATDHKRPIDHGQPIDDAVQHESTAVVAAIATVLTPIRRRLADLDRCR